MAAFDVVGKARVLLDESTMSMQWEVFGWPQKVSDSGRDHCITSLWLMVESKCFGNARNPRKGKKRREQFSQVSEHRRPAPIQSERPSSPWSRDLRRISEIQSANFARVDRVVQNEEDQLTRIDFDLACVIMIIFHVPRVLPYYCVQDNVRVAMAK